MNKHQCKEDMGQFADIDLQENQWSRGCAETLRKPDQGSGALEGMLVRAGWLAE